MSPRKPDAAQACRAIAQIHLELAALWEAAARAADAGDQSAFDAAVTAVVVNGCALDSAHHELSRDWERTAGSDVAVALAPEPSTPPTSEEADRPASNKAA